jgi:proliferating cell nuclear antigen
MAEWMTRAEVAKKLAKAVVTITDTVRVYLKNDGIHLRAVDPSNVAMIIVNLPRESCDVYVPPTNGETIIGVDFSRVNDILKSAKKKDMIDFKVENDEKLLIRLGNITYSTNLVSPDSIRREPKIPELNLPAKVVLDGKQFKNAIAVADKIGDHVTLTTDEDGFHMITKGDLESVHFHMGEMDLIEFNKEKAKAMFSIEYLKEFTKIIGDGDIITVKLGDDYPVWLDIDTADGELKVTYILAPRIENEY